MKRALVLGGTLAALALGPGASPAAAQVTLGWDVAGFSDYVWRGVTYTNKFVIQPDLWLNFPVGKASLTVGGWANIEPSKYNGTTDLSEGGGAAGPDLAEFDWWAEVGIPAGVATVTLGATGYYFPNDFGFTSALYRTYEAYGKVGLSVPLSPKLAVWYDVDKVKGAYFEGSVSHGIPLGPAFTLNLGALAGLSAGQAVKAGENANFFDDGFTHADLSASTSFAAGPLSIAPAFHLVITGDEFTKFSSAELDANTVTGFKEHGAKVWFGATISWSKAFGGSEAAAE